MADDYEKFLEAHPDLKRLSDLIWKVGDESERGMTVLVAAEQERALDLVLKAYLVPGKFCDDLFNGSAPALGPLSSKINLARALQLIRQDEYEALQSIRRIRNEFAHNPNASFQNDKISSWVAGLGDEGPGLSMKERFERRGIELIATLEEDAVEAAQNRLSEEQEVCSWYRRGHEEKAPTP